MKKSTTARYLKKSIQILRRNGLRNVLNLVKSNHEFAALSDHKRIAAFLETADYSTDDLVRAEDLMKKTRQLENIKIETLNWFIQHFQQAFAGITTILRFADYFHSKKGIKNRFAFYEGPEISLTEERNEVAKVFPGLASEEMFLIEGDKIGVLPYADISIATRSDSARAKGLQWAVDYSVQSLHLRTGGLREELKHQVWYGGAISVVLAGN